MVLGLLEEEEMDSFEIVRFVIGAAGDDVGGAVSAWLIRRANVIPSSVIEYLITKQNTSTSKVVYYSI